MAKFMNQDKLRMLVRYLDLIDKQHDNKSREVQEELDEMRLAIIELKRIILDSRALVSKTYDEYSDVERNAPIVRPLIDILHRISGLEIKDKED